MKASEHAAARIFKKISVQRFDPPNSPTSQTLIIRKGQYKIEARHTFRPAGVSAWITVQNITDEHESAYAPVQMASMLRYEWGAGRSLKMEIQNIIAKAFFKLGMEDKYATRRGGKNDRHQA